VAFRRSRGVVEGNHFRTHDAPHRRTGLSAAAMLGTKWIDRFQPAELVHDNRRPPPNLIVRSEVLFPGEIAKFGDMQVPAPAASRDCDACSL
jgi:hypothetical protein